MDLHGLAVFKPDGEILNNLSLIGKRLGRIHDALGNAALRGDKDLLGGDVRIEIVAEQGIFAAALELGFGDHAHTEIRAVGAVIFQRFDVQCVEVGAAVGQILVVLLPRLHGVVRDAGGCHSFSMACPFGSSGKSFFAHAAPGTAAMHH